MISCILLTAGESARFGSPKALAKIGQGTALDQLQKTLLQSTIGEIIIVTGAHETLIKPHVLNHNRIRLVYNKDYKLGQTSSFQAGISSVDTASIGFMLLPIDCPFILPASLNHLCLYFQEHLPDILIPSYQGRKGHPPIFHAKLKESIFKIPIGHGLNSLPSQYQRETLPINDPGIVQTFNTAEELENIINKVGII